MQQILVTGGAGFIGSHTVDLLLEMGKQVVVLDNLSSGKLTNLNLKHPDLEFIEGDVLEYPLIEDLLKNCDAVLHLAAIASVPQSIEHPVYTMQVNTQGFLHVLQAVYKANRKIHLVYASSASVYGEMKELPCHDDVHVYGTPLSPYALQKIHCEEYADLYAHIHNVKSLGLRYFNAYGDRQDPNSPYSGVISRFLDAYHHDQELKIHGDGKQSRDFIHVKDIARANVLALESDFSGAVNIATGVPQTLLDLVQYMQEAGEKPVKYHHEPRRHGDIPSSYAAVKMAEKHLGFQYTIPLSEGIKMLMQSRVKL